MGIDTDRMVEAASALGFRASRDPDGSICLVMPPGFLSPRMKNPANTIADDDEEEPGRAMSALAKMCDWLEAQGYPVERTMAEILAPAAATRRAIRTARSILDAEADLDAARPEAPALPAKSPSMSSAPAYMPVPVPAERLPFLIEPVHSADVDIRRDVPRQSAAARLLPQKDAGMLEEPAAGRGTEGAAWLVKLEGSILEPQTAGGRGPSDFPGFVRGALLAVRRAVDRVGGYTERLQNIEDKFLRISEYGPEIYQEEDQDRARRLLAMAPDILSHLEGYSSDDSAEQDKIVERLARYS